jgi:hypothetical protein
MAKDDFETGKHLFNPYIEIGKGKWLNSNLAYINVTTFKDCLEHLIPSFTAEKGETLFDEETRKKIYSVYGTVGRTVITHGSSYLNITEPPVSRTFMGFLLEEIVKRNLPHVHKELNQR